MKTPLVDLQSTSEILRASAILLIHINDINFSPWLKEESGDLMARDVIMQVTIDEVLKGKVRQNVGEPFEIKIQQRGTGGLRVMDFYGIWSQVDLVDGARFVAFCTGSSDDASVLLKEDYCKQLVDPKVALDDIKAAIELENQGLSDAEIIAKARLLSDKRGRIFARYVFARSKPQIALQNDAFQASIGASVLSSEESFNSIISLIADKKTTNQARDTYLTSIYEELSLMALPPKRWVFSLIRAMFTLLTMPEAKPLYTHIRDVYLPNLIGLNYDSPNYLAEEVFKDHIRDIQMVIDALKNMPQNEQSSRLIKWLENV